MTSMTPAPDCSTLRTSCRCPELHPPPRDRAVREGRAARGESGSGCRLAARGGAPTGVDPPPPPPELEEPEEPEEDPEKIEDMSGVDDD
jgi:hypothetical protein